MRSIGGICSSFLLLAGCGSPATGVPLERAGAEFAATYCAKVLACCEPAELAAWFPAVTPAISDEASCVDHVGRVFGGEFTADVQRAVSNARAVYDGERMAACLDLIAAATCAETSPFALLPRTCAYPAEGVVPEGGACGHNFECASGYCEGDRHPADGACRALPRVGDPCPEAYCEPSAWCSTTGDTRTCLALTPDGEACASDFACTTGSCAAGVCEPRALCDGQSGG